ncbi:probable ubiquitin-like-specific protease 2A [Carica papaya]|uniref:probable ubiquitin-like-specific protease 2A n=1 Tax=Carica papaya TaxID=3649 RepID=UPI000B8C8EA1|nr:probable ubiquitin-like-specific protease 2A [Carica papaya]XP_021908881.1 probable ubiquitin-like-specific protease 2A [Carica papaya]XP_021908882.1 probable ubiquitin-like-specific protease 2A [Carica papaya]XP_021908883.1 probable ubiquitin-like-specific protease 2A [Carica papaya]XP_021908884.1 probable ubiquitin-like-specific protease 2A [Carica papaya]
MRRRNISKHGAKSGDLGSPVYEVEETPISKHRTCWLHVVYWLRAHNKRVPRERIREFERSAPCFFNNFPHRERSQRRTRKKYAISRLKKRLDSEAFSSYLEVLWRSFSDDKRTSFIYLDCLWFSLYKNASFRRNVLLWIKNKHIFSKKYVFVPIVCWNHWFLLIFCNFDESLESKTRRPCMLLLDSLARANPRRLEPDIRKFVFDIYESEGRSESKRLISQIPLLVPKVPQQRNGDECGNFVLYFINLFMKDAPEDFSIERFPYFMVRDWFDLEGLDGFCEMLDSLASDFS